MRRRAPLEPTPASPPPMAVSSLGDMEEAPGEGRTEFPDLAWSRAVEFRAVVVGFIGSIETTEDSREPGEQVMQRERQQCADDSGPKQRNEFPGLVRAKVCVVVV